MKCHIPPRYTDRRTNGLIGITPPYKHIPFLRRRGGVLDGSVLIPRVLDNSPIPKVERHNIREELIHSIDLNNITEVHSGGVIALIAQSVEAPPLKSALLLHSVGEILVEDKDIAPIAPGDPPAIEIEDHPLEPALVEQGIAVQEVLVRGVDVGIVDIEDGGDSLALAARDIAVGVEGPDGVRDVRIHERASDSANKPAGDVVCDDTAAHTVLDVTDLAVPNNTANVCCRRVCGASDVDEAVVCAVQDLAHVLFPGAEADNAPNISLCVISCVDNVPKVDTIEDNGVICYVRRPKVASDTAHIDDTFLPFHGSIELHFPKVHTVLNNTNVLLTFTPAKNASDKALL